MHGIIERQLLKTLSRARRGILTLTLPDGRVESFGGAEPGAEASAVIHDSTVFTHLALRGDSGFMDDYSDGKWDSPSIENLLTFVMENEEFLSSYIFGSLIGQAAGWLAHMLRPNSLRGSQRNIHAHYDLGNDFYRLWLDPGMTYSAALFQPGQGDLRKAQDQKYDRLLDRLQARSGSLLEIGCGWGGLAERAVERGDYRVKGLTLSQEQHAYAQARLGDKAQIALEDYRTQKGVFDNIVSIEMFEAVGERYWPVYFRTLGGLLRQGGRAAIQTITIDDARFAHYRRSSDCIRAAIFPGGMLPSPSRFAAEVRDAGPALQRPVLFRAGLCAHAAPLAGEFRKREDRNHGTRFR